MESHPLTEDIRQEVLAEVGQLNRQGLRVLGVGYKSGLRDYAYAVTDESDMIHRLPCLFGSTKTICSTRYSSSNFEHGVKTKILTEIIEKVTWLSSVKRLIGQEHMLLGCRHQMRTEQGGSGAENRPAKLSPLNYSLQLKKMVMVLVIWAVLTMLHL